tara:strand:- start:193 stop:765 length:573 start_codon:yes stop_codon:yes gene_type:complete
MLQKVCTKCSETKELTEFHKDKNRSDGLVNACKVCKRLAAKKWSADNADRVKANGSAYYVVNKERLNANSRQYSKDNKDSLSLVKKEWSDNNREKVRASNAKWQASNKGIKNTNTAKRRAAKLQRTVSWSNPEAIKAIYAEAAQLTIDTGIIHHVDHRVPLQGETVSGFHHEDNLQILTASENLSKSNKF